MTPKLSGAPLAVPPAIATADHTRHRARAATGVLSWLLPSLLALEAALGVAYLWAVAQGQSLGWIDFNVRQTLPSFLQAGLILALAGLCGWRLLGYSSPTPSRLLLRLMVLVLTFAAIDEVFKLHLISRSDLVLDAFTGLYFGLIVALPLVFFQEIGAVWRLDRGSVQLAAAGLLVFCVGVFAANWIRDAFIAPLWPLVSDRAGGVKYISIVVEEVSELWGETCILLAALRYHWVTHAD